MAERVGIVAAAQTRYEEIKPAQDFIELVYEVVEQVLQQTGLTFSDRVKDGFGIDGAVSASQDHCDARTISSGDMQEEMGGYNLAEEKVANDGSLAFYNAVTQVLSGDYDVVLVVSHTKESHAPRRVIENCAFDPIYQQPVGLDYLTAAALQAKRYMYKYDITREQCAKVVVKNRGNAKNNPYAQAPLDLSVEEVLKSPMLADPITALDTKPFSDGACALIIAKEEKARKITDKPVWVTGMANCYDAHYLGSRELADCDSLVEASRRAYRMSGISNPFKEIDVVELSEEYSYQELLWMEGLGLCERGGAGTMIDRGITEMNGDLPVNPSGGVLSGCPMNVAGMARIVEATLQLRGEAGARQVEGARTAIAQGTTGPCGQSHCVIILSV
ncbi:MAG: thiolase family protein [Thermodesulfobacteriota bacterium]|nr:thiolase family protein [Thermodesulfobacteriota bacterium]